MPPSKSRSGVFQAAVIPFRSIFPSTHYFNFAQAILYRDASFDIVWRSFAIVAAVGLVYFTGALSGSGER